MNIIPVTKGMIREFEGFTRGVEEDGNFTSDLQLLFYTAYLLGLAVGAAKMKQMAEDNAVELCGGVHYAMKQQLRTLQSRLPDEPDYQPERNCDGCCEGTCIGHASNDATGFSHE